MSVPMIHLCITLSTPSVSLFTKICLSLLTKICLSLFTKICAQHDSEMSALSSSVRGLCRVHVRVRVCVCVRVRVRACVCFQDTESE